MKTFALCMLWLAVSLSAVAQVDYKQQRIAMDPRMEPFYHGVASGDPLADRVIIWTRITLSQGGTPTVDWAVATDTGMTNIVKTGNFTTNADRDYTVKVDVDGLQANTWYYYQFSYQGQKSIVGRTKTAPSGPVSQLRFAVASCADYQEGFYNAYNNMGQRNDFDAVVFLGDYIYEYGASSSVGREHEPATEILTLSDYRMRHSQYKLDIDLQYAHQQYPWICVWDDHETTNDSYRDGAENHTPGTEGDWQQRKRWGVQAYLEWMPIRVPDNNDSLRIYRTIRYGDLVDIFMLDTRLYGRDQQVSRTATNIGDTTRFLLGQQQLDWLKTELSNSTAQWKLLGQQVMMAPLRAFGITLNADQWDGYTAERDRVLNHIKNNNINNVVVLTGDIHSSWGNDIPLGTYNGSTGAGSVAVEYVATSITSSNFPATIPTNIITSQNPHIKYADLTNHGYFILDLTAAKAQADWYYVNTIATRTPGESFDEAWYTNNNDNHLTKSTTPTTLVGPQQTPAPRLEELTSVQDNLTPVVVGAYPNPFQQSFTLQYFLRQSADVTVELVDVMGKVVMSQKIGAQTFGLTESTIAVPDMAQGTYFVRLVAGDQVANFTLLKQ